MKKPPDSSRDSLGAYFNETLASIKASKVDWKKEIESLQKKLKTESGFVEKSLKKLKNPGFLNKAPEKVIIELMRKSCVYRKNSGSLESADP